MPVEEASHLVDRVGPGLSIAAGGRDLSDMTNAAKSKTSSWVRRWFGITLGTDRSQRTTPSKVWPGRLAMAEKVGTPEHQI